MITFKRKMLLKRTNIKHQLEKLRDKNQTPENWRDQVQAIFVQETKKELQILSTLKNSIVGGDDLTNHFDFDQLDSSRIFHIDQIERICIDYRLRFLDTKFFKGKIPQEAVSTIKQLEKDHQISLKGFKIIAPSKLFKLENADDPLLFAPMGNSYFYLIHKWGNDLHPLRKLAMWSFKSLENLLILTLIVSVILTALIPNGLFTNDPTTVSTFLLELFFMFKSVAAIVLFYGVAKGKNFNPAIWRSKYYNA